MNHDPGGKTPPDPTTRTIIALIALDVLLMVFCVVLWQLNNGTLAATAGAGAIALTVDIARRLLNSAPAAAADPIVLPTPSTTGGEPARVDIVGNERAA